MDANPTLLLEKQAEDLKIIRDKLVQFEQKNTGQEIVDAIYLELGRALHGIAELREQQQAKQGAIDPLRKIRLGPRVPLPAELSGKPC